MICIDHLVSDGLTVWEASLSRHRAGWTVLSGSTMTGWEKWESGAIDSEGHMAGGDTELSRLA